MAHLLDELRVDFSLSEGMFFYHFLFSLSILLIYVVKCLMKQLMEGVEYIHKQDIIHRYVLTHHISISYSPSLFLGTSNLIFSLLISRDIKMSNLLYTHNGVLKLGT